MPAASSGTAAASVVPLVRDPPGRGHVAERRPGQPGRDHVPLPAGDPEHVEHDRQPVGRPHSLPPGRVHRCGSFGRILLSLRESSTMKRGARPNWTIRRDCDIFRILAGGPRARCPIHPKEPR